MSSAIEKWIVTFGSQYGTTEEHPVSNKIHRDGYVTVEAENMEHARFLVHKAFGIRWSFLYSEQEWADGNDEHFYPLGALGSIDAQGVLTIHGDEV